MTTMVRALSFVRRLWPGLPTPVVAALLAGLLAPSPVAVAQETANAGVGPARAVVLEIDGPIGPATSGYVTDGLNQAAADGADLVVLRMDTPGGLSAAMRDIISAILASPVPVASFVAPTGARAASAGTYISYAAHVAAMAPGTTLGAATPVQLGGGSSPLPGGGDAPTESEPDAGGGDDGGDGGGDGGEAASDDGQPADAGAPKDAKTAKAVNDAVAYIRALAQLRGRNADWAVKAVREAATLTADEAAARNVVDLVAEDVPALLDALDGRAVAIEGGTVTLDLAGARIERAPPDWRDRLLAILTDPNVAFILMMIGVYGLIFEFANPGAILPGVVGAICLLLGLYALNVLPVNYAGLALIGVGVAFMLAEAFVPSFGALGLGGLAAFAVGSVILFDTGGGAYTLSYWTIGAVTALTGAVLILVIVLMVKSQRRPVATGEDTLIGLTADVADWSGGRGRVRLHGEYWNAVGPGDLSPGTPVRVIVRDGLTLRVAPATRDSETQQPVGA